MDGKNLIIALVAAAGGLVAGFLFSNSINRNELSSLRAENELLKNDPAAQAKRTDTELTTEEIRATIQKADASPGDFQTQKNVGVAIYRYAVLKQDPELLQQSIRIMDRANSLREDDYDIHLSLGNAYFDVGYFNKDNEAFAKARQLYAKVLAVRPGNADVVVDVGLTYFLQTPPDYELAVREFRRSLEIDPKHEKTLQFMVQTLIKQNKSADASEYLEQLRTVNPRNQSIAELTSMLANPQPAG